MSRPTLYLVDGFALAYRAYFALIRQPLLTATGQNINAVHGVTSALLDVLEKQEPDHLGFVLDHGRTFRHEIYPDYKANRAAMPPEMREQLDLMNEMVQAMGIPIIRQEGFEADDLLAALASQGEQQGLDVYLVSADKDLFQLVTEHVRVLLPPKSGAPAAVLGPAEVEEKFGVGPAFVADVLALAGDSSDNVPGVQGVGPKTAIRLVKEHGHLGAVLAARIKGKLGERLSAHAADAELSYRLVKIEPNAPVKLELDALRIGGRDEEKLRELVVGLESERLLERMGLTGAGLELHFEVASSKAELASLAERIREAGHVTIDTETTGLDAHQADLVGISLSLDGQTGYYIPIRHRQGPCADLAEVKSLLGPLLNDPAIGKTGQNIKYDLHILERAGLPVQGVTCDTMVASYLLDSSSRQHGLDFLAMRHLSHRMIPISALIGERRGDQLTMDEVGVEQVAEYAAEDASVTHRLRQVFLPKLQEQQLMPLFERVEVPLIAVLGRMERHGVAIDQELLARLSAEMLIRSQELEAEIHDLAGGEFNVNSPKQLQVVLFEKLGLKPVRKTKTGYSTDARVLETLAAEHPVPRLILRNRELVKLRSTYVETLPRLVNPHTGRIHTSFHQTVAATGRLSSTDPNLQNIPIRTEEGRRIRQAFVAGGSDRLLFTADYSQIELRILAHLSADEGLRRAFTAGEDIHRATAAKVFGVDPQAVDLDLRRRAKAVNFGIIYGMGAFGLASRLGIPVDEAAQFIEAYFQAFPGIRGFIDATVAETRERGFVETMLKRRRYLPEINERNRQVREAAERMAVNTAIQGSAADLIKLSMIRIDERLRTLRLASAMTLQVHDELVFDARRDELEELEALVVKEMESAFTLHVPLRVDVGRGWNWLEAHE